MSLLRLRSVEVFLNKPLFRKPLRIKGKVSVELDETLILVLPLGIDKKKSV